MIYGAPQFRIDSDATDLIGIRNLVMSKLWQPSRWPMSVEELDAEAPEPPEVPAGLWIIGAANVQATGSLRRQWHFEGINGNGRDITFKTRANSPHYGFQPGFAEMPIQAHPKIETLLDEWEGTVVDNQVFWPQTLSEKAKSGLGGKSTEGTKNKMFGRETYFAFQGGTYWYRYMARSESEIPDIIGRVFKGGLPGNAPRYANRDWLCAGVPFQRRGPAAIEVVEQYWLSDDGGWPPSQNIKGRSPNQARSAGLEGGGIQGSGGL